MRRLLALCATLSLLPATALAKEVRSATVCGADGCHQISDHRSVAAAVESGGPPGPPPNRHAGFYRVDVHIKGDPQPFRLLVVPALHRVRADGKTWLNLSAAAVASWRRILGATRPLPAARLPDVDPAADSPPAAPDGVEPPTTYVVRQHHPAPAAAGDDGAAWWLIAGGAGVLAALAGLLRRRGNRRPARGVHAA